MPLIKSSSQKAFTKNLKKEMDAGQPKDRALAIAYSVQKQAKKKGMSSGGMMEEEEVSPGAPSSIVEAIRMKSRKQEPEMMDEMAPEHEMMETEAEENLEEMKPMSKADKIRARIKRLNGRE